MTDLILVPQIYYNVKRKNAACDGVTDDTTPISNAISAVSAAGGGYVFLPGLCAISAPLTLPANVYLVGAGYGTGLKALAGFSGAQMVLCNASNSGVLNMSLIGGPSTTYSSNPATNGVQVTGAAGVQIGGLLISYVNGWGFQSTATAGQANQYLFVSQCRVTSSAQGFHSLGVSGSGNAGNQQFIACTVDHNQNGDCYLFEDVNDILVSGIFGTNTAGSGNSLHIKGNCSGVFVQDIDLGPYPGPTTGATILIESDVNGAPNLVTIKEGITLGGTANISITAGTQIILSDLHVFNGGTYGISITGGDNIQVRDCIFSSNGFAGTTGRYDLQCTTSGAVEVIGCRFATPQGTTSQHTNNAVNFSTGTMIISSCKFSGSGYNSSNIFNGVPTIVRHCAGYNPVGNISVSVPSSGTNFTVQSVDVTYFVTGGTVSAINIGGVATGLTSGAFRVPATQTFSITYSVAPTVKGFAD